MNIQVLIADDHPLLRDGIRSIIERSGKRITIAGEASDGHETLRVAETLPVDVFILDITMPGLNGIETAREIRRKHPNARIIMLSCHDTRGFVEQAFEAGARGYLTKDMVGRNVVEAVITVHGGRTYLSPDVAGYGVGRRPVAGRRRAQRSGVGGLTARERVVLQRIAEGRSNREIASDLGCAFETVRTHRKNLMAKLGIHKDTGLVRFAISEGLTDA